MNAFNMHCHLLNVEARNDNSTLKIYIAKVNIASPSNLEPSTLPHPPKIKTTNNKQHANTNNNEQQQHKQQETTRKHKQQETTS